MGCDHNYQERDGKGKQYDADHDKDSVLLLRCRHEYVDSSRSFHFGLFYFGLFDLGFLQCGLLLFGTFQLELLYDGFF